MNNRKIFLALLVLSLPVIACATNFLGQPIALVTLTPVIQPTNRLPEAESPPASPAPTASRQGKVCFDEAFTSGALRVRECPGLECREVGILDNHNLITVTGERKDVDNTTWLRVVAPIEGWVSSRYICEK